MVLAEDEEKARPTAPPTRRQAGLLAKPHVPCRVRVSSRGLRARGNKKPGLLLHLEGILVGLQPTRLDHHGMIDLAVIAYSFAKQQHYSSAPFTNIMIK